MKYALAAMLIASSTGAFAQNYLPMPYGQQQPIVIVQPPPQPQPLPQVPNAGGGYIGAPQIQYPQPTFNPIPMPVPMPSPYR